MYINLIHSKETYIILYKSVYIYQLDLLEIISIEEVKEKYNYKRRYTIYM